MSEWRTVNLSECIRTNTKSIDSSYKYETIVYLDTGSITCNKIDSLQEILIADAPSRARRLVKDQNVIYSSVRPNQLHYGFIINPIPNLVVSTGFVVIESIKEKIIPKFLYYFLTQSETTEYLHSIAEASTSAYPSLKPSDIEALEITLPPLPEQRDIASVLSSLDDKIDLLHRQNKTLEAMAETLFRQWFVEEADVGWKEGKLKQYLDIGIGRTPPRQEHQWFSESVTDVKWISIKDLGNDGVYIFKTAEYLTCEAINRFNIPIIPKNTVVLSFKMTVGRVAITCEDMLSNEAIAHFKIRPETPFSVEYLYLFLKTYQYDSLGSTSSIVTAINSAMIKDLEIVIPDSNKMRKFNFCLKQSFEKIRSNQIQIRNLEKLRDTLLPKLMSGEVRVEV